MFCVTISDERVQDHWSSGFCLLQRRCQGIVSMFFVLYESD